MDNSTEATGDVVDACPKRVRVIGVQRKEHASDKNGPSFAEVPSLSTCDENTRQRNGTEISEINIIILTKVQDMAIYNDLSENSQFMDQRFGKKNNRNSKFGFKKNASPEHENASFNQPIHITGFRMFLGSKRYECSNKIIYADYSGYSSNDFNNFSIKLSEPVISRIVIRTNSFNESRERNITSEKKENALRTGLKSDVEVYQHPFSEADNAMKLKTLPFNSSPRPKFRRHSKNYQSINLAFNQNKKDVIRGLDEGSENMETSSSFTTSSESLGTGNIPDMSSLVLSNMKTGRLSRIASFVKNMWNGASKETNELTEQNSQLNSGNITVNKNQELKLPHKSFDNLNGVHIQNQNHIYQDPNCTSHHSISDKIMEALDDTVRQLPSRSMSSGNSFCVQGQESLKKQSPEYANKAVTEFTLDTRHTESVRTAKLFNASIPLESTEDTMAPGLPNRDTIHPVGEKIVQNMPTTNAYLETCVRNKEIEEIEPMSHGKFNEVPHIESKMSSQTSNKRTSAKSKSVIFCPSSHSLPGTFDDTLVSLCDDCHQRTKKTVSEIQLNGGSQSSIMNKGSDNIGKEHFTHNMANQPREFKGESVDQLPSHVPRKLNIGDLDVLLETVNNHLLGLKAADEDFLKEAIKSLNEKWILVISNKNSRLKEVRKYLKYLQEFSEKLLEMVLYFTDREGNNAFHFTCGNERFDIVEELLNYECAYALLTKKNKLGHSPLMICSVSKPESDQDWSTVKKMFSLGDVNDTSSFCKQTPLMNAASRGYDRTVRLLLESGADPNLQDKDGSTALMYAAVQGHEACVVLLLGHPKCNSGIKDYEQQTACLVALAAAEKEIALRIYLHSKGKRSKDSKIKPMTNNLQKNFEQLETNSKACVNAISQSDHQ